MPGKPRVLMYGWELPPNNSGGMGVACYGLTKSLASHGTKIAFALPKKLDSPVPFMEILDHDLKGVEVTAINSLLEPYQKPHQYLQTYFTDSFPQEYGADLYAEAYRFADSAYRWSTSQNFDLVHGHDWMTYPASMLTASKRGKPFVAHVHATEYDRTGDQVDERIADIEYRGLHRADKIITVSNYTQKMIQAHYGISQDKITVVHNGHDPVKFSALDFRQVFPQDHVVLFVGRLTYQKGVEYFLRSAQRVLQSLPNTVFIIAGNGDMYTQHLIESARLNISSRVLFTGFLQGRQLQEVYQLADVFVMPSVSEPYGIVALEAIAAGKPAIISKTSGVSETVSSIHKVDFWDTIQMANLIEQSLLYPEQAKFINSLARREIKNLTWDRAAQKTLTLYRSLLS